MALTSIRLGRESNGSPAINLTHIALRILQVVIGIVVLIMYATQPSYEPWANAFNFSLGIAAGALALSAIFLAPLPFIIGFSPFFLAGVAVWDFIVMIVYAATFAHFKTYFPYGHDGDVLREVYNRYGVSYGRINVMRAAISVVLTGMLFWLVSFLLLAALIGYRCVKGRSAK